jgi:S-methylmethionine-dependent homocysteine/selenocysteine methylase
LIRKSWIIEHSKFFKSRVSIFIINFKLLQILEVIKILKLSIVVCKIIINFSQNFWISFSVISRCLGNISGITIDGISELEDSERDD